MRFDPDNPGVPLPPAVAPAPAPAPPPPAVAPAIDPAIAARIQADENAYLSRYPDVAAAVAAGQFSSGRDHFDRYGRAEGRLWGVVATPAPAPQPAPAPAPAPAPTPAPPAPLPPLPDPATWRGGHVGREVIDELIAEGYPVEVVAAWARAVNAVTETVNPYIPPPPDEPPAPAPAVEGVPDVPADVPLDAGEDRAEDRSLAGASASFWRMLAAYTRVKYTEGNRRILNAWAASESTPALINNPLAAHRAILGSKPWPANPQIQWYADAKSGAYATSLQLRNGNYDEVVAALRKGNDAIGVYNAIHGSAWHQGARQDHYPADLYDYIYGKVSPPVNEPPAQPQPAGSVKPERAQSAWEDLTWYFGHQWPASAGRISKLAAGLQKSIA